MFVNCSLLFPCTIWRFFLQFFFSLLASMWAVDEGQLAWQQMKKAIQHRAITVSSGPSSFTQAPQVTAWSQHSRATHRQTCTLQAGQKTQCICTNSLTWHGMRTYSIDRQSHRSSTYTNTNTVTGCGCKAQQDWNVTYCYCSHLATIEDHRQLAPQCLRADLCRSLSATGCCGSLLSSFNYLGIRSLVQQLL